MQDKPTHVMCTSLDASVHIQQSSEEDHDCDETEIEEDKFKGDISRDISNP